MFQYILPICTGAVFGAVLRWASNLLLPASAPLFNGNLLANWAGAFLIGLISELTGNPQWKLLLITGFLGSLTTFSGFSLETVMLMQSNRFAAAFVHIFLHTAGSLLLTFIGLKIGLYIRHL